MFKDLLKYPIIQAPMAGGASTPKLAASVSNAGGLGFLAAGYKTAEEMKDEIGQTRQLTERPFGVNVFVPGNEVVDETLLSAYGEKIKKEAESVGAEVGKADSDEDDWGNKLTALMEARVAVVSFTFGCPSENVIRELQSAGSHIAVTVTNLQEAKRAASAGADVLCVQGIEAGGHRASFENCSEDDYGLLVLIRMIENELKLPIIAAGGLMRGKDIAAVLAAGATAAQLGTAFLRCPESGASPVHKAALGNPRFTHTSVTRAFSGRRARGLVNHFLMEYDSVAPAAYPYVHHMTKHMRKAAGQKNNPELMALWAGQGYKLSRDLPASELMELLVEELK
ncbi:nitronate monooxygenase [Peribacillus sp. ACCC06369]|uniref:nitronate monooxygenase n=1 Tax=Peribacillus sp. ACCC06369 TaxID=3055860 RepID=UPI0025A0687C|nr:nitronate monooxygenase [Peribacillus sp. ACCC06369]MDM5357457.1 nitronate monooxygenase [Peribacillus sp. ACCC06369]